MAFESGPVTFRRFFITGPITKMNEQSFAQAVNKHAFGKYGSASADGSETGWISPDHLFDANITAEKIFYDRFVYLQMRLDRTAPPGNILRSYLRMEELAARDQDDPKPLTKRERQAAREAAVARAQEEAKAGMYRRIAAVPVLIDLRAGVVYFGNLGATAGDKFIILFRDTFDSALEPGTSDHLAFRIMDAAGDPRAIEEAQPFHLVSPRTIREDHDNEFHFDDQTYLGREFLTWLWYKTDVQEGMFSAGGENIAAMIAQVMRLDCDFKLTGSDIIRSDGPGQTPEAKAAIAIGKQPTKIGLILGARGGDYSFVLDGPRFTVSGLRLPDPSEGDRRARLEERFGQIAEVAGLLDMLYALFVGTRASPDWPRELGAMTAWATPSAAPAPDKLRFPALHPVAAASD